MSGGEKTLVIKNEKKKKNLLSNVRYFGTWEEICVTKILLEILKIEFF